MAAGELGELLDDLATEVGGIERAEEPGAVNYGAKGVVFAVLEADGGSFRLRPDVVRGALGTPDTAASPRGADWVRFRPAQLDTFAHDRAEAWFRFAYRRATGDRRTLD
jgi:hypothetical protein